MGKLEAALSAADRGCHIFPVVAGGKVPHPLAGNWSETATNDRNRIGHFWTNVDPQANIGISCKRSGLLVVDCDMPKSEYLLRGTPLEYLHAIVGPNVKGEVVFDELRERAGGTDADLDTYRVNTGSGGLHMYFSWPGHWPVASQASLVRGLVDVRSNGGRHGGYVLAEGSETNLGPYEHRAGAEIELPPLWLRMLVVEKPAAPRPRGSQGLRQPGAVSWSGLVDSVQHAGVGNRNNALLWASRAMCGDGATLEEAKSTLGPAAAQAGLDDFEIDRTIESGYRVQQQKDGTR